MEGEKIPKAAYRRLLILGLDALPWPVMETMIAQGAMPFLAHLRQNGFWGNLHSTVPHQTPSAWTTFMTGVEPGWHEILGWERFDPARQIFELNHVEPLAGRTIFRFFSDAGLRVGIVLQPGIYPPFPVNGFLLSGFDGPGLDAPFAWPRELEKEILELCPDHSKNLDPDRDWDEAGHERNEEAFSRNIDLLIARVRRVVRLALQLRQRHPVDVFEVYFHDPDLLLHRAWVWCQPDAAQTAPGRFRKTVEFFRALDEACQELSEAFEAEDRLTLVLSDHGQREDILRVRLNSILIELGFLVPAKGFGLIKDGLRRMSKGLKGKGQGKGVGMPIAWERTRAFMPYQACTAFLYLNLRGRQPDGAVDMADYRRVRGELIEALEQYRDPSAPVPFFSKIGTVEDLYGRPAPSALPDIFVQPAPGVEFVRKARPGQTWYPTKRPYAGLHDPDGIYILGGQGIRPKKRRDAHLAALPPTLLAALGLEVPEYMKGEVLSEAFENPLPIRRKQATWDGLSLAPTPYSTEEEALIAKRLADLGYLR